MTIPFCVRPMCYTLIVALVAATFPSTHAMAQDAGASGGSGLVIPAGTFIYCELDEGITSKKKDSDLGQVVRAHVWQDVTVNGAVVIKAGTPARVEISKLKRAGVAGRKGDLELAAISTKAIDGTNVMLTGGYDRSGNSRVGLSVALSLIVFVPLIFLKGKQAQLERGILFDCTVQGDTTIQMSGTAPPVIRLSGASSALTVEILYDEMEKQGEPKDLPLKITKSASAVTEAQVVSVGGNPIKPLMLKVDASTEVDGAYVSLATLELKELSKHLAKGINRFEVQSGTDKIEVILNVEL